jgi:hypothetical protein
VVTPSGMITEVESSSHDIVCDRIVTWEVTCHKLQLMYDTTVDFMARGR